MRRNNQRQNRDRTVISIAELRQMADTKKLEDILHNCIENEKIPSVRMAWVEYFLDIKNKKIL
jgi:hypothetical protein